MENEKMSAILYRRCHANTYPNLSRIAKVYSVLSTSFVSVETRACSVAGSCQEFATLSNFAAPSIVSALCLTTMLNFFP